VDAIHPGFGFLSENAHFADICEDCGITFIGPSQDNIREMGDKNRAREIMRKAGVPVTPGSDGVVKTQEDALVVAKKLGYPVLIKAVAGGGGKGMRIARNDVSLAQGFMTASSEAERAFGNATSTLRSWWSARGTSKCSCWRTTTGMSTNWASAIAASSAGTRSCWRRRRARR
jgi:acetyl/propionyl-CoA carboxylase alpha subunit